MARRTISCWEDFARNDEGGGVGAKVLEEVGQAVQEHECTLGAVVDHFVVSEAHGGEDDGQKNESHVLDRLATPLRDKYRAIRNYVNVGEQSSQRTHMVNKGHCGIEPRDEAGYRDDQISDGGVL